MIFDSSIKVDMTLEDGAALFGEMGPAHLGLFRVFCKQHPDETPFEITKLTLDHILSIYENKGRNHD